MTFNEAQTHITFKLIEDIIIKTSQLKINWMHKENNNTIQISINKLSRESIYIKFPNFTNESNVEISIVQTDVKSTINRLDPTTYEIFFEDPSKNYIQIALRHNDNEWNGWRYVDFHILDRNALDPLAIKIYSSLALVESISHLINSLEAIGFNDDDIHDLRLSLNSALFREDWRHATPKMLRAFYIVEKAIAPYTVGAHGYSFPLKSQGMEDRLSRIPAIFSSLESLKLPWFCTSGTLLGLIREGSLIEFDDDLDFVVYIGTAKTPNEFEKIYAEAYSSIRKIATPTTDPFLFKLKGDVGAVDIFIAWTDKDDSIWVYPWCPGSLKLTQVLPAQLSMSLKHPIKIPATPEVCLELNYGPNWQHPDPTWRFNWEEAISLFADYINTARSTLDDMGQS
jgi:hypothetical protein